jgi:hypothetical protein
MKFFLIIEEEKEPEKTSSLVLDSQSQGIPQTEQEVETVLDTELPNAPQTRANSTAARSTAAENRRFNDR